MQPQGIWVVIGWCFTYRAEKYAVGMQKLLTIGNLYCFFLLAIVELAPTIFLSTFVNGNFLTGTKQLFLSVLGFKKLVNTFVSRCSSAV
jgi:hypothetical protein